MPKSPQDLMDEVHDDAKILSFIVRVWREESNSEGRPAIWRGHITLVPSGERHYFTNISQIPGLIVAHLNLQR